MPVPKVSFVRRLDCSIKSIVPLIRADCLLIKHHAPHAVNELWRGEWLISLRVHFNLLLRLALLGAVSDLDALLVSIFTVYIVEDYWLFYSNFDKIFCAARV